uniref:Methylthioribose-1-phosphate isomerase n=1 Tax=Plectus sambesii TaxID=2011161 RepID=A0A914VEK5_9BILA
MATSQKAALESIRYEKGKLEILDQLLLPSKTVYIPITNVEDGWRAINTMQIRGAPAIAILGMLSLSIELQSMDLSGYSTEQLCQWIVQKCDRLLTSRPTAVNLRNAREHLVNLISSFKGESVDELKNIVVQYAETLLKEDIVTNRLIGDHGADAILSITPGVQKVTVLTICNTGSLATAGYGTALGVVRSLHARGKLEMVYFLETRPYNQGSRLTAFELLHDEIPATLICDSMAAWLMKSRHVDAIVVGADNVALNGDLANKVGTYALAVLAHYHNVPFFGAVPTTTINPAISNGSAIIIEERAPDELTVFQGIRTAPVGVHVWNPAFDITPHHLISGIITELGSFQPEKMGDALAIASGKQPL